VPDPHISVTLVNELNLLAAGLFLLATFGLVATRQVLDCVALFAGQSVLLAASAALLGREAASDHLYAVAAITIVAKALLIPWLLRRTASEAVVARREISQVLNIPTSLLIALGLSILAYFLAAPLRAAAPAGQVGVNLPIGLAALLIGAFTVTVRREALPQVLGLLSMENGAFFAGVAIAPDLPLFAELAAAFDVLVIALVMGLLTRKLQERAGSTSVADLTDLREE
jgi:hydrogenase-4 component E